ncbi:MAG: hypothetical protein HY897_17180 [Deltaproteobacteria bacterium]|nr:hypothetical protein [Deltaproteobacteria bacterium]
MSGRCFECSQATDCLNGEPCLFNMCASCANDAQCKAAYTDRPFCSANTDKCIQCTKDADCTAPGKNRCTPEGQCVQCLDNAHCSQPQICQEHLCRDNPKLGPCEYCTSNDQCQAGYLCKDDTTGFNRRCRKYCDVA